MLQATLRLRANDSTRRFDALVVTTFVEGFVVYLFLIQGLLPKFLFLNMYLLLSAVIGVARYAAIRSHAVFFPDVYFASEALLMIFLFLTTCELSLLLFGTSTHRKRIMLWSLCAFVLAALLSFSAAVSVGQGVATRFLIELSQEIFYVCCIAVVLLWAWKLCNDPADRIAARLANVLAVYFLLFLLMYGASQLTPHVANLGCLYQMSFAWLPLGCGFVIVSPQPSAH